MFVWMPCHRSLPLVESILSLLSEVLDGLGNIHDIQPIVQNDWFHGLHVCTLGSSTAYFALDRYASDPLRCSAYIHMARVVTTAAAVVAPIREEEKAGGRAYTTRRRGDLFCWKVLHA